MQASACGERGEAGDEVAERFARGLVGELTLRIEQAPGTRDLQATAGLVAHLERAQHRQPGVLREDRAEAAR